MTAIETRIQCEFLFGRFSFLPLGCDPPALILGQIELAPKAESTFFSSSDSLSCAYVFYADSSFIKVRSCPIEVWS